jgi:hypothetical protein
MTKKILIFLIISFSVFSQEKENSVTELNVGYTVEYNIEHKADVKEIIQVLKGFIKTKNSVYKDNPYWIKNDNEFYKFPFLDVMDIETNGYLKYKPTLISITQVENQDYIAKIGWFSIDDEMNFEIKVIYNFHVVKFDDKYLIKNILNRNILHWKIKKIGKITYYYPEEKILDLKKGNEFDKINSELASYFETEPLSFKYFICKNNHDLLKLRGFDFEETMFFSNQNGSETFPQDLLIFSGNNDEINTHELVHLYTHLMYKNKNSIIDEGIATYLGGSKGFTYKEHLLKLSKHLNNNEIDLYNQLFFHNYVIDYDTSLKYTLGAFLCDLALKKKNKDGLKTLLNSGKSNEELIQTIEKLFEIKKENFNQFIKFELEKFPFD